MQLFSRIACLLVFAGTCYGQVTINEVMAENKSIANWDGTISDWIELYNSGTQPVNLESWSLTDSAATPRKWVFPKNVTLPARGYLLVALDSGRTPSAAIGGLLNAGFGIKGTGDNVALYSSQSVLIDSVRFGPQAADFSIGAIPGGSRQFVLTTPTPGSENLAQSLGSQGALRINEWMVAPSTGKDWFEIYNGDSRPVQLSGLYFIDTGLAPSPVAPLSFIGTGRNGYLRFNADNSTNDNEVSFKLGASTDAIGMYTFGGSRIDSVEFGQQTTDKSQGRLPDGSGNIQTLNIATPNESNLVLYDGLWVNEILTHTDPPFEDAVEFYNNTGSRIDLSGWYLSNSRNELNKYKLPPGTGIESHSYLVIYENQFNGSGAATPFTFNSAHGDRVILAQALSNGALTGYIVEQEFGAAERGYSFGRVVTSVPNDWRFTALQQHTFGQDAAASVEEFRTGKGAANAAPRIGPIIISEIMYNPSTNNASADAASDPEEFIELTNLTGDPVPLYDLNNNLNVWKLEKGISFSFPRFTTIPPYGTIVIVSFDPQAEPAQLAAFNAKYSVPDNARLLGPFLGKLDNRGESVVLSRPDEPQLPPHPDAGFVPYIEVDRVDYSDQVPWPLEADGLGKSLEKGSISSFGNDPGNWRAATPSPGMVLGAAAPIQITSTVYSGGTINLIFTSVPGKTYSLQYRSDLNTATIWRTLSSSTAAGTQGTISDTPPPAGTKRFYRISTTN